MWIPTFRISNQMYVNDKLIFMQVSGFVIWILDETTQPSLEGSHDIDHLLNC